MANRTGHSGQLGLTKRCSVQDGGKPHRSRKIQERSKTGLSNQEEEEEREIATAAGLTRIQRQRRRRRRKKKKGEGERATESNKQTSKQSKAQKRQ
jgi:hypothetical protein